MSTDLDACRRFYAEEVQMISNIRTPALVEALATVPRERFLPPGPWAVRSDADAFAPMRHTPGDDPRFVYHNVAVGIDPARMLFNGAPGMLAMVIDALALEAGSRVLHVGAGTGYYTAVMAETVGPSGHVVAVEVDADLAAAAAANLADKPWVDVCRGDGRQNDTGSRFDETTPGVVFDAIFVNAGVTHAEPHWLTALAPGGRIILPVTATMELPQGVSHPAGKSMANISKGFMLLVTATERPDQFTARIVTFAAIYSAIGLRDPAINAELGRAMTKTPFPQLRRFRLDAHEPDTSCWCHSPKGCWSTSA
jgi:protein-L-isoaspartate(D-aspartate) O-methyltransferase